MNLTIPTLPTTQNSLAKMRRITALSIATLGIAIVATMSEKGLAANYDYEIPKGTGHERLGKYCCPVEGVYRCGTKIECDLPPVPHTAACPEPLNLYCHNAHGESICFCR